MSLSALLGFIQGTRAPVLAAAAIVTMIVLIYA